MMTQEKYLQNRSTAGYRGATAPTDTVSIFGKIFTYKEIKAFVFTLFLISLALAFPLKSVDELKKSYHA